MEIDAFLNRVNQGERVSFTETQAVIDGYYRYTPVKFSNGLGDHVIENNAGANEGSCKIFSFALLNGLVKDATLNLFGHYYWNDVLQNPDKNNHLNIRNFIVYGWDGIRFSEPALTPRELT